MSSLSAGAYQRARDLLVELANRGPGSPVAGAILAAADRFDAAVPAALPLEVDGPPVATDPVRLAALLKVGRPRLTTSISRSRTITVAVDSPVDDLVALARHADAATRSGLDVLFQRAADPLAGLRTVPPSAVLEPGEVDELERALRRRHHRQDLVTPMVTAIVKVTRMCNLRCGYCHDWRSGRDQEMSCAVLVAAAERLLAEHVSTKFIWHGGEPLARGAAGLLRSLVLIAWLLPPGHTVENSLQTNGTLVTPAIAELLRVFRIPTSVSMDGPPELHDRIRVDAAGRPTSAKVLAGIDLLKANGIFGGLLVVLTKEIFDAGPERLVDFCRQNGITSIGLLPVRPMAGPDGRVSGPYLSVDDFCSFLLGVRRVRVERGGTLPRVRELDTAIALLSDDSARFCELAGQCAGGYFSIEPDGQVAHCDKFVGDPAYTLGNVLTDSFATIRSRPAMVAITTRDLVGRQAFEACEHFERCRGWCPHERYVRAALPGRSESGGCCGLGPLFDALEGRDVAEKARVSAAGTAP